MRCRLPLQVRLAAAIALALLALANPRASADDKPAPVTIFVAASTEDAVKQIAGVFTDETKTPVRISAGATNALANQIIEGAPADLFLAANRQWADKVSEAGHAAKSRDLLAGDLVVIVPKGNPAGIRNPKDLLDKKVTHVALAGEKVPAGMYAAQALKPEGIYDRLLAEKKIVRGQDVRQALAFVERGEAEAGVVYWTDALNADKVTVAITFDPDTYDAIVYPLLLLKPGEKNPATAKFFDFLRSDRAADIFTDRGFRVLR